MIGCLYSCSNCGGWSETQDTCCSEKMDNFFPSTVVAILNSYVSSSNNDTKKEEKTEQVCKSCKHDVTEFKALSRKYYDKQTGNPCVVVGHNNNKGVFVADGYIDNKGVFIADDDMDMNTLEPFKGKSVCFYCGDSDIVSNINEKIVTHDLPQYCKKCDSDLSIRNSVARRYHSKQTGNPVVAEGHYDNVGDFISDVKLDTTRLDLFDDLDECCGCASTDLVTIGD